MLQFPGSTTQSANAAATAASTADPPAASARAPASAASWCAATTSPRPAPTRCETPITAAASRGLGCVCRGLAGEALGRLRVVARGEVVGGEAVGGEQRLDGAAELARPERAAKVEAARVDVDRRRDLLANDHLRLRPHPLERVRRRDRREQRVSARVPRRRE